MRTLQAADRRTYSWRLSAALGGAPAAITSAELATAPLGRPASAAANWQTVTPDGDGNVPLTLAGPSAEPGAGLRVPLGWHRVWSRMVVEGQTITRPVDRVWVTR